MALEPAIAAAAELVRTTRGCASPGELVDASARLPGLQVALVNAGAPFWRIGAAVSEVTDALTRRLIELAEERLGAPPAPYAWLACGSQARREQTVLSDQDNALMLLDERLGQREERFFAELAREVNAGLAACGFPRCRGGIMAENELWRRPPSGWRGHFDGWIDRPTMRALMHATIFFDMRVVVGDDRALRQLFEHVRDRVRGNHIFFKLMAANAIDVPPPLGLLGGLRTVASGEHAGALDVKRGGVMPVVDLARVHALEVESTALSTLDRLRDAASRRTLSAEGAEELCAAFELCAAIRSRHQAAQITAGVAPDNFVSRDELGEGELRQLKSAFRVIRRHQEVLARRH